MPLTNAQAKTQVQEWIDENKLMFFSLSYCPFCVRVLDLFKQKNITDFKIVEFDKI